MPSMMERMDITPSSLATDNLQGLLEEQNEMISLLGLTAGRSMIGPEGLSSSYGVPDDDFYDIFSPTIPNQDGHEQVLPHLDLDMITDVIGPSDENLMETGKSQWMNFAVDDIGQTVPVQNPLAMISGIVPVPTPINQGSMREDPMLSLPASPTVNTVEKAPETRTVTREEENTQARNGPMELPSCKELLIRIRYRSQEVVREHVKNPNGCLVYYNKPWQFNMGGAVPTEVKFPDITLNQQNKMTDPQLKFTVQIQNALQNGLHLRCDDIGNVYATRYCQSKVFWWSTEKGPIAEGNMTNLVPQKLERNTEVMVFDYEMFKNRLRHFLLHKPTFRSEPARLLPNNHISPISPAVFLTFAQPWNPNEGALSSCLVSMIVNPVYARVQHHWGNADQQQSFPVSDYKLQFSSLPRK